MSERDRGLALMEHAAGEIVHGVERLGAAWVVRTVTAVADAWGRLPPERRARLEADARRAGDEAAARVVDELRALFARDAPTQAATPLEVVRTLRWEATAVLAAAGVPPVERDPFEARAFPDDDYGIVPRSLADLGDDDLGPMLVAWGMGKSLVMREGRV